MEVDNGTTCLPSIHCQSTIIVQARCRLFNLYCQWSIDIRVNWRIGQTSLLSIMKPSLPCRRGFRLDSRSGYCRSPFPWNVQRDKLMARRQQLRAVAQPNPPAELKDHFTKETYSRATAYSISKLRYSLIKTVFDQTFQYYLIKYHVYSAAWDFAGDWMDSLGLSQSRTVSPKLKLC
jgi:hypothetical protein